MNKHIILPLILAVVAFANIIGSGMAFDCHRKGLGTALFIVGLAILCWAALAGVIRWLEGRFSE